MFNLFLIRFLMKCWWRFGWCWWDFGLQVLSFLLGRSPSDGSETSFFPPRPTLDPLAPSFFSVSSLRHFFYTLATDFESIVDKFASAKIQIIYYNTEVLECYRKVWFFATPLNQNLSFYGSAKIEKSWQIDPNGFETQRVFKIFHAAGRTPRRNRKSYSFAWKT